MKKILLHICCANCATVCVKRLREKNLEVWGIFYNPNIQPNEEYLKRKQDVERVAEEFNLPLIEADYNSKDWFSLTQGHENDEEGGPRCKICFKMRLAKTYEVCLDKGFDLFTTTLTISPHKNSELINKIGFSLGKEEFLSENFKKSNGFIESVRMSKQMSLYRQNYCGCIFSQNKIN